MTCGLKSAIQVAPRSLKKRALDYDAPTGEKPENTNR